MAIAAGALVVLSGLGFTAPAQAAGTGMVSILHAVPGLTVDVYANGQELLSNFTPGTLTKPKALPAGSYDITIFPAGRARTASPQSRPTGSRPSPG